MFLDSRRKFLQYGFLSSSVFIMSGCSLFSIVTPKQTIELVQNDIFPKAKELGVNTFLYMSIVLNHSRISEEDKEFIKNGVKWLNEEALEMHDKIYAELPEAKRQETLKAISQVRWGENWLETILTYTLEAMISDPVYGVNKNYSGQKWLHFEAGFPRPKEALL